MPFHLFHFALFFKPYWNKLIRIIIMITTIITDTSIDTQQTFVSVKTLWRSLQCNIVCLPRRFQEVLKRLHDIIARHLHEDVLKTFFEDALKTRLEDVLKTSSRRLGRRKIVKLKTSSRRFEDVLENKKCLLNCN